MTSKTSQHEAPPTAIVATEEDELFIEPTPPGMSARFSEIKLIQKELKNIPGSGKHGGEFYLSDTGEFRESLTGVIVMNPAARTFFEADNADPLCQSNDGIKPVPGGKLWELTEVNIKGRGVMAFNDAEPASCSECLFSRWDTDETGKRIPPACGEQFVPMFEDAQTGFLYRYRIAGSAVSPFKDWYGRLMGAGVTRKTFAQRRAPYDKIVEVTSVRQEKGDYVWYTPQFHNIDNTADGDRREYAEIVKTMRSRFITEAADAVEAPEGAAARHDDSSGGGWNDDAPVERFASSPAQTGFVGVDD